MKHPGRDPRAYIDGRSGLKTTHPQVPVLDFTCDEEIAELILLMNQCHIPTLNSCQHDTPSRQADAVRRIWVQISGQVLLPFLGLLDKPEELSDRDSLSNRIAFDWEPDDWEAFRRDRMWHYSASVQRLEGQLMPLAMNISFPYTDLEKVVARLQAVLRDATGRPSG